MGSDTLVRPDTPSIITDRPDRAHIVRGKGALLEAILEGKEVEALCGYRWVPSRDPEGLPVCEACKAIAGPAAAGLA